MLTCRGGTVFVHAARLDTVGILIRGFTAIVDVGQEMRAQVINGVTAEGILPMRLHQGETLIFYLPAQSTVDGIVSSLDATIRYSTGGEGDGRPRLVSWSDERTQTDPGKVGFDDFRAAVDFLSKKSEQSDR